MRMDKIIYIFIFWTLVQGCTALIGHDTWTLGPSIVKEIDSFGYTQGGTLTFSSRVNDPNANITFMFCTDKEFQMVNGQRDSSKLCSGIAFCSYEIPLNTEAKYTVDTKDLYHLVLVKCSDEVIFVGVDYVFLNPYHQQLSFGYIPLPSIYISFVVVWFLVLIAGGVDWMRHKNFVVIFHSLLGTVVVLKFAVVVVAFCYWQLFHVNGTPLVQLQYLQSLLYAVSETAFFCSLLLIAKGWRITRTTLPASEIRTISVALVLLLSTLLFFSFYNEGYYFLSLMIMYFFMLPKIFTSITRNTRALQTQMLLTRYANNGVSVEPLLAKMKMFKTLRTSVILYLGAILMVSSMRIIMLWYLLWINYCVSEIIAFVMVTVVVYLLRPREHGAFSTRAFLEGNPYPLLSMQNLDHFDDFFGEQLFDPEVVLMNAGLRENLFNDIDMSTIMVVEFPSPPVVNSSGKTVYYPRLALGSLEKPPQQDNANQPEGVIVNIPPTLTSRHSSTTTTSSNSNSSITSSSSSSHLLNSSSEVPLDRSVRMDIDM